VKTEMKPLMRSQTNKVAPAPPRSSVDFKLGYLRHCQSMNLYRIQWGRGNLRRMIGQ
jgi:hypothetical protein